MSTQTTSNKNNVRVVEADVQVNGSGLTGTLIAHFLSRLGRTVVLTGTDKINQSETVHAQGIIHSGMMYAHKGACFSNLLRTANELWESDPRLSKLIRSRDFQFLFRRRGKRSDFLDQWEETRGEEFPEDLKFELGQSGHSVFRCGFKGNDMTVHPIKVREALLRKDPNISFVRKPSSCNGLYLNDGQEVLVNSSFTVNATGRTNQISFTKIWTLVAQDPESRLPKIQASFPDIATYVVGNQQQNVSLLVVTHECDSGQILLAQTNILAGDRIPSPGDDSDELRSKRPVVLGALRQAIPESKALKFHARCDVISLPVPDFEFEKLLFSDEGATQAHPIAWSSSEKELIKALKYFISEEKSTLTVYPVRLTIAPLIAKHIAADLHGRLETESKRPSDRCDGDLNTASSVWENCVDSPEF